MIKNAMQCMMVVIAAVLMVACAQESERASYNLSQAAHNFEVNRRVVFYNGITGEYILTVEGLLSVTPDDRNPSEEGLDWCKFLANCPLPKGRSWVSVTVKTGPSEYKKHYLGVSDNVTWFCEQIDPVKADPFHYRVIFRPTTIIPDAELQVR